MRKKTLLIAGLFATIPTFALCNLATESFAGSCSGEDVFLFYEDFNTDNLARSKEYVDAPNNIQLNGDEVKFIPKQKVSIVPEKIVDAPYIVEMKFDSLSMTLSSWCCHWEWYFPIMLGFSENRGGRKSRGVELAAGRYDYSSCYLNAFHYDIDTWVQLYPNTEQRKYYTYANAKTGAHIYRFLFTTTDKVKAWYDNKVLKDLTGFGGSSEYFSKVGRVVLHHGGSSRVCTEDIKIDWFRVRHYYDKVKVNGNSVGELTYITNANFDNYVKVTSTGGDLYNVNLAFQNPQFNKKYLVYDNDANPNNGVLGLVPFCYEQNDGECKPAPATSKMWIKIPKVASSGTTYVYGVNIPPKLGELVFHFYDNFVRKDYTKWYYDSVRATASVNIGTPTVQFSSGQLSIYSNSTGWRYLRNTVVWTSNATFYQMDARVKVTGYMTGWLGFIGDMDLKYGVGIKVNYNNLNIDFAKMTNGTISTVQTKNNAYNRNVFYRISVKRFTADKFFLSFMKDDYTPIANRTIQLGDMQSREGSFYLATYSTSPAMLTYDWVRIRKAFNNGEIQYESMLNNWQNVNPDWGIKNWSFAQVLKVKTTKDFGTDGVEIKLTNVNLPNNFDGFILDTDTDPSNGYIHWIPFCYETTTGECSQNKPSSGPVNVWMRIAPPVGTEVYIYPVQVNGTSISNVASTVTAAGAFDTYIKSLPAGWHLVGTSCPITGYNVFIHTFDQANYIWLFKKVNATSFQWVFWSAVPAYMNLVNTMINNGTCSNCKLLACTYQNQTGCFIPGATGIWLNNAYSSSNP